MRCQMRYTMMERKGRDAEFETEAILPVVKSGATRPVRLKNASRAPVVELVDALDSKSSSERSAGSIPARGTISSDQDPARDRLQRDRPRMQVERQPQGGLAHPDRIGVAAVGDVAGGF